MIVPFVLFLASVAGIVGALVAPGLADLLLLAGSCALAAARDLGAKVVSNDRFRDWAKGYPEVRTPGHVLRGGYRSGKLWLDMR